MAIIIEKPRNGCALHGAVQTIEEIKGAVPIIHSNAGCAMQNYLADKASGFGNGYIHGLSIPGTDVQERHVIFGGASRLREQIKNTLKVVEGELYIVLNSCESAMVGDDLNAMTREANDQGEPVIDSLSAGFHGDNHYGYEAVVTDIIKKLPNIKHIEVKKEEKLVNIFGILPGQDIYFRGDLAEIKRILEGIGLKVNTFFGPANGVEEFLQAGNAELSLVFSKWGEKPANTLKELYEIPVLTFSSLPTGISEVWEFVGKIGEILGISKEIISEFLQKEEERFRYYFERITDGFYEEHYNRTLILTGDESNVVKISGFLRKYFGAEIEAAVITDFFKNENVTEDQKKEELKDIAKEIYFSQDGREIYRILVHSDAELLLGSSLENNAAKKKGVPNFEISYPVYDRAILNKTYTGITGAITLAEDYITKIKESNRLQEQGGI